MGMTGRADPVPGRAARTRVFVILAGIRTALAINVGTVPLAFLIGGGGLGELIFTGIDLMEPCMMLAGAIPTALLAVLVDFLVGQCQYWLDPARREPAALRAVRRTTNSESRRKHHDLSQHLRCAARPRSALGVAPPPRRRPSSSAARTSPSSSSWPR